MWIVKHSGVFSSFLALSLHFRRRCTSLSHDRSLRGSCQAFLLRSWCHSLKEREGEKKKKRKEKINTSVPFLRNQTLEWCWENRRGERGAIAWIHSKLGRLKSHDLPEDGDPTPPDTRWHFTGPQHKVMTCRVTSLRRDAECQPQRWFRRWLHYDWKHEGGLLWAAGASESAEAAARQEWSHFIRQQPVGLPGWFMAAILCQNLTTNQVCHEKEADTRSV